MLVVTRFYTSGKIGRHELKNATLASVSDHFRKTGCSVRRVPSDVELYECRDTDTGGLKGYIEPR